MIRAAALLACLLLAACGQRGDLYMPDEARPVVVAPANPAAAAEGTSEEEEAEGQQQGAADNAAAD